MVVAPSPRSPSQIGIGRLLDGDHEFNCFGCAVVSENPNLADAAVNQLQSVTVCLIDHRDLCGFGAQIAEIGIVFGCFECHEQFVARRECAGFEDRSGDANWLGGDLGSPPAGQNFDDLSFDQPTRVRGSGFRVGFQPSVEPAWNDGARCSRVQVSRSAQTLALRQHLVARVRQRHVLGVLR